MDWLVDVPCAVDVVLGTATVRVHDVAALEARAIVALAQPAGADLEVRVAGRPIAAGEVVVTGDSVALRIRRVLPPAGEEPL